MKYFSRLLSACLVLVAVFSITCTTGIRAAEVGSLATGVTQEDINLALQTGIPQVVQTISMNPDQYGIADDSILTLGSPFGVSSILDGQAQASNQIVYFPIVANDEIIAFTTVVKIEGKLLFGNIMDNESARYNKLLKEDPSLQYALVSYPGESVFAISEVGDVVPLSSGGQPDFKRLAADLDSSNQFERSKDEGNVISWDVVIAFALTQDEVMSLYDPDAMDAYIANRTSGSAIPQKFLQPELDLYRTKTAKNAQAIVVPPAGTGDYLDGYQTVPQGSLPICWAAAVASMIRWELPSSYPYLSGKQVCDKIGHPYTEGTNSDVVRALKAYLPTAVYKVSIQTSALTRSIIRNTLLNEDPAYIYATVTSGNSSAHGAALNGYLSWTNGLFSPRYMNPGTNANEHFLLQVEGDPFYFVYNNTTWEWRSTVRLMY